MNMDDEELKFNELLSRNPNKGIPTKIQRIKIDDPNKSGKGSSSSDKIIIPKWVTGLDEDSVVPVLFVGRFIKSLGFTCQLLYDVIELGLTDISQRPKCNNPECVNSVKFMNLANGYRSCCSRKCGNAIGFDARNSPESKDKKRSKLKGRKISSPRSEEWRRKQRESRLGRKQSQETINKRRETQRLNKLNGKQRKPLSHEVRVKIGNSLKGRTITPESIAKGLATKERNKAEAKSRGEVYPKVNHNQRTRKGYKVSEESRMKMSKAQKKRAENESDEVKNSRKCKISIKSKEYFKNNPDELSKFIMNGKLGSKRGFIKLDKYSKNGGEFYYMSSWENELLYQFDSDDEVIEIFSPPTIEYFDPIKNKTRLYIPDIGLVLEDKSVLIIEVKPYEYINDPTVVAKRVEGINFCKVNGYTYITLTENELRMKNLTIDYIKSIKDKYYNY